jgi:hypothetical protein
MKDAIVSYHTKLICDIITFGLIILSTSLYAQQESVDMILNKDGRIKAGQNGSYNAKGYTIGYGKKGEPILRKSFSPDNTTSTTTWSNLLTDGKGNGVNSWVTAIAVNGSDVYVGGWFTTLGDGTSANHIAKWNGNTWSVLPCGTSNGVNGNVFAIVVSGSDIYVRGEFTTLGDGTSANHIAKWNGSTWSVLPCGKSNGVNGFINAIAVSPNGIGGNDIYVGGAFTSLGDGTSANHIAKWNGNTWSVLTCGKSNGVNGFVTSIAVSPSGKGGNDIYVGGWFITLGDSTSANYIAKWNGSTWSVLPCGKSNGVNGIVNAIAVSPNGKGGSDVYAGGQFTTLGDSTSANNIAKWNGNTWSGLTCGSSNGVKGYGVYAIAISPNGIGGSNVYVGGRFTSFGDGTSANNIAKWNGSKWSVLPYGKSNGVYADVTIITVNPNGTGGSDIYVGGQVYNLGDDIYADNSSVNCIAKWDGSTWSVLPCGKSNGVKGSAYLIAVNPNGTGGSDVYVGGEFTFIGDGTSANHIAKWDGSNWSVLPCGQSNGVNDKIYAIAVCQNGTGGSDIYVGGEFTTLGDGTSANHIAKWNGRTWSALPCGKSNGVNDYVTAIAVSPNGTGGSDVYVGGHFIGLGDGTFADHIAKWNGSNWSVLPYGKLNGVIGDVNAIAVCTNRTGGSDIYVGGLFTTLGDGTSANHIAKWNGSTWSVLPCGQSNGVIGDVNAIAVSPNGTGGSDIYVGGEFNTLGDGTSANCIAKWDGSNWSVLPCGQSNGFNYFVNVIAVNPNGTGESDVYVGGEFNTLGDGTSANHIAKWNGSTWLVLPCGKSNGVNHYVYTIAVNHKGAGKSDVYVGGNFTTLGDSTSANNITKWNGSKWEVLSDSSANGVNGMVLALAYSPTEGKMYAGGSFTIIGADTNAFYIAMFH